MSVVKLKLFRGRNSKSSSRDCDFLCIRAERVETGLELTLTISSVGYIGYSLTLIVFPKVIPGRGLHPPETMMHFPSV